MHKHLEFSSDWSPGNEHCLSIVVEKTDLGGSSDVLVSPGSPALWLPFRCPPAAHGLRQSLEGISWATGAIYLWQDRTGERAGACQVNKLNEVCNRLQKYQLHDQSRTTPQETIKTLSLSPSSYFLHCRGNRSNFSQPLKDSRAAFLSQISKGCRGGQVSGAITGKPWGSLCSQLCPL